MDQSKPILRQTRTLSIGYGSRHGSTAAIAKRFEIRRLFNDNVALDGGVTAAPEVSSDYGA